MLLITDRPEHSRELERLLSLWGPCTVVALGQPRPDRPLPVELVVSDVDLSSREAVDAVRAAIAASRPAPPCLCLLRDQSARMTVQAHAIGASAIMPADAAPKALLDAIGRILDPDGAGSSTRRRFVAAAAAMADLLAAAAAGRSLPVAAIEGGVEAINRAADDRDLSAWLDLVWNHDDATYQHCLLVAGLAAAFARALSFPDEARRLLTCAAVLHDIGKARIPLEILHKPGKLTEEEFAIVREHPQIGYEMLRSQGAFAPDILAAVRSHHEYLDGSGYPQGLSAGEISDVVRMITICDVYAALIERRAYKAPNAPEDAYAVLTEMGGRLDADLLRAFRTVVLPA